MTYRYSQHAISILNIDDNDLNFDLDDDVDDGIVNKPNQIKPVESQIVPIITVQATASRKRRSPSPTPQSPVFKPPAPKTSSIEITKFTDQNISPVRDECNSVPLNINKSSNEKFEVHNQSLFDLFDTNDIEEESNHEGSIDRNKAMSSTQKSLSLAKPMNLNQSSIIEQQVILSPEKLDSSKLIDKIYAQSLNHDKVWLHAKDSIIEQFNNAKINVNLLEKYSIKNCINKVNLLSFCIVKNFSFFYFIQNFRFINIVF